MQQRADTPYLVVGVSCCACAGEVKEFGFRPIPEDGNYASHFSGDTSTPRAATGDSDETPFSGSRPSESDADLIDLDQGQGQGQGQGQTQGSDPKSAGVDRDAVEKAISAAESASKQQHPHLHQRHQQQQGECHLHCFNKILDPVPVPEYWY